MLQCIYSETSILPRFILYIRFACSSRDFLDFPASLYNHREFLRIMLRCSPSALQEHIPAAKRKKGRRRETTRSPRVRARMLDPRQTVVGGLSSSRKSKSSSSVSLPNLPSPLVTPSRWFLEVRSVCTRLAFPFIAAHSSASPSRVLGVTAFFPASRDRDPKSIRSFFSRRRHTKKNVTLVCQQVATKQNAFWSYQ